MSDKLHGTWKTDIQGDILYLTVNGDGTCVTTKGGRETPGTWKFDGKVLLLKDDNGPDNALTVVKITENTIDVEIPHGPKLTLERSDPPAKAKPPAPIWQLSINWGGCEMAAWINGFPAGTCSGEDGFATQPLNPRLIGKGNELKIEITGGDAGKAKVSAKIEVMQRGDVVDTGAAGGDFTLDKPGSIKFDSDLSPFADVLAKAKKQDGPEAAIEFGRTLLGLAGKKDAKGLLKLFGPKMEIFGNAMGGNPDMMPNQFMSFCQEGLFAIGLEPCKPEDIEARPFCDNRVWEIRRKNGDAILRTKEQDGGFGFIAVYAADLGDGFGVVS